MMKIAALALALLLLTGILLSGLPVYATTEGGSEEGSTDTSEPQSNPGDSENMEDMPETIDDTGDNTDDETPETPVEPPIVEEPVEPVVPLPPTIPPPEELPICDGTPRDCITNDGNVCLEGQGGHECECEEDMSDCPNHPSLKDGPIHPCLLDPADPICPKPDPVTGDCPEGYAQNEDGNCFLLHPNGCPKGYHGHEDDETGRCIPDSTPCDPGYIRDPDYPTCSKKEDVCKKHPELRACGGKGDDDDDDNDDRHKIIIKNINIHNTIHNTADFPEVDVIGLSVKNTGEANVCIMNIDNDWVQCQEFGVPNDRINEDIWRVIETDRQQEL